MSAEHSKRWRARHREKSRADSLARYYANRERYLARGKLWAANNPDKVREAGRRNDAKAHRKLPRGNVEARQQRYRERHREKIRARHVASENKRRADPAQRIVDAIRRRMRHVIRGKSKGAFDLFGYSAEELRQHLSSQFQPGMTWENYGLYGEKWHVDHKRPVSSFNLPDELRKCFALENLQPLWAADNLRKRAKHAVVDA